MRHHLDLRRTQRSDDLFLGKPLRTRLLLRSGDHPAEPALGQLDKPMARSKLAKNFAFNHECIRARHIDENGCQIFIPGGLRRAVKCHRYGASIWLPALECIQTGEDQQCSTTVLRLEAHHGHLRLLVRREPCDRLLQASSSCHDRDQQSIATECGNRPQVGLWRGLRGRGGHQTADLSTRCASVTRKWRGRQSSSVIHASTSTSDKVGGSRVLSPIAARCRAWHIGLMPAVDTVLLPLCVGLTLLGVIATGIAWRRGHKGRVIQGIGLALAPIALYFSGLLRLLWDAIVAFGTWASKIILSPAVWFGLSLLGLCVVLWVVGGLIARRSPKSKAVTADSTANALPAKKAGKTRRSEPPVDEEMAEIEALLKSRGIE